MRRKPNAADWILLLCYLALLAGRLWSAGHAPAF